MNRAELMGSVLACVTCLVALLASTTGRAKGEQYLIGATSPPFQFVVAGALVLMAGVVLSRILRGRG